MWFQRWQLQKFQTFLIFNKYTTYQFFHFVIKQTINFLLQIIRLQNKKTSSTLPFRTLPTRKRKRNANSHIKPRGKRKMDSPIGKGRGRKRRGRGRGGNRGMRDNKKWSDPRRGGRRRRPRRRSRRARPPQRLHPFPVISPLTLLLCSSINNRIFYRFCSCKRVINTDKRTRSIWLDRGVTYGREKRRRGWQRPGQWDPSPPPHRFTSRRRGLFLSEATSPTSTASTFDFRPW